MRKVILMFLSIFLVLGFTHAQESNDHFSKKNAIKINPVAFGNANFQMTYERFLGERTSSIMIAPSVTLLESNEESKSGWEVMGQYRFYLTHLRKDKQEMFLNVHNYGFYTGVYGLYSNYKEDFIRGYWDEQNNLYVNEEYNKVVNAFEGGALIGIQIDVTKRILVDFYIGGGIRQAEISDTYLESITTPEYYDSYGIFDQEYKGVKPKIGLLIGFSF